jgi:mRNA-degrading endonuclease YafQ of YafQ-DinJ toxin-antitoxin module
MKNILLSPDFQKKLLNVKKKDRGLFEKIEKQLKLFSIAPQHPSLRLHKLRGNLKNVWSISVSMNFRVVFLDEEEYYFFDMGFHDQIYRK